MTLRQAQKATHSSLRVGEIDHDANFADNQRLARLSEDLRIARINIDASADVGKAIEVHCAELRRTQEDVIWRDAELLDRVRLDLQRLTGFRRAATALLGQAEEASRLVCLTRRYEGTSLLTFSQLVKLLDYRKVDTLSAHVEELRSLAMTSSVQGESLRDLTEKTRYDSRYMRILTFMAVAYLPASLLAVSRFFFYIDKLH